MGVRDTFNKLIIYLQRNPDRWPMAVTEPDEEIATGRLGPYQLDLTRRLEDGHFMDFDENGLPVRFVDFQGKRPVHLYSTLCCFGLAHWDTYLKTGALSNQEMLIRVADYVLATGIRMANGAVLLRGPGEDGTDHAGPTDALDLGQSLSVLCRAYQTTRDNRYLEMARGCMRTFNVEVGQGGIRRSSPVLGAVWYEEAVTPPLRHILNGMICALWGLRDLAIVDRSAEAERLFVEGVDSVIRALPQFDTGFWSYYWIVEPPARGYVATMNYHLLHICQLRELWKQTGLEALRTYADRFQEYACRPTCRLRAFVGNIMARLPQR